MHGRLIITEIYVATQCISYTAAAATAAAAAAAADQHCMHWHAD